MTTTDIPAGIPALRRTTTALLEAGRRSEAFALWSGADFSDDDLGWLSERAGDLMRSTDLTLAGEFAHLLASIRRGSRWFPARGADGAARPIERFITIHKLRHDIEQFTYLLESGDLGDEFRAVVQAYTDTADRLLAAGVDPDQHVPFDEQAEAAIGDVFNRIVTLQPAPRLPRALSDSWNGQEVTERYLASRAGLVVVDNFLSPAALDAVRRFCAGSTVWFGNRYANGRLGAFFHDGFNCPLLLQVAEELRGTLPDVLGPYPLRQLWGFKNKDYLPGDTTTHADFAAVNVNFWITPTEANLDESSGGLIVYGVDAPPDWNFHMYNGRQDLIKPFLARRKAEAVTIPYRANRAIIFNSDLFHATAEVRFRPGYENRRVNITMLYGERADDVHHPGLSRQATPNQIPYRPAWRSNALTRRRAGR
ncbi:hypothetical protein F5972_35330 [Microbispora cellulosiformans]|uniref:Uncharacterized protein n=1 Tax=Microbispora cellulosiformans TaxID=2614688 RepID=A0A5J5JSL8_9ACTN|nr:hypothetical protein [Microbispora cellulosiformans]KAA9373499.1 hypothetical protein F5972_35330 [Microbispora cellulosiformans]